MSEIIGQDNLISEISKIFEIFKASNIVKRGAHGYVSEAIFKDPKTQDGKSFSKTSARGYLKVVKENDILVLKDNLKSIEDTYVENEMESIYKDGQILKEYTLNEIRERIKNQLNESIR